MKNIRLNLSPLRFINRVCFLLILGTSVCALVQADTDAPLLYRATKLSQLELDIWNNPAFKKQFTESYIAETEIEPRVTIDERYQMQKILKLISSDKMDEAALKLEKLRNEAASAVFDFTLANIYFLKSKGFSATFRYRDLS